MLYSIIVAGLLGLVDPTPSCYFTSTCPPPPPPPGLERTPDGQICYELSSGEKICGSAPPEPPPVESEIICPGEMQDACV